MKNTLILLLLLAALTCCKNNHVDPILPLPDYDYTGWKLDSVYYYQGDLSRYGDANKFIYDEEGKLIEWRFYTYGNANSFRVDNYEYDDNGLLEFIESVPFFGYGSYRMIRDDNLRIVKVILGESPEYWLFEYLNEKPSLKYLIYPLLVVRVL